MTTDQFLKLSDDQLMAQFTVHRVIVDGRTVSANVERSLIPDGIESAALLAWVGQNAREAINRKDDGNERHAGGTLGRGWTWVYRVADNGGGVTILNAGA